MSQSDEQTDTRPEPNEATRFIASLAVVSCSEKVLAHFGIAFQGMRVIYGSRKNPNTYVDEVDYVKLQKCMLDVVDLMEEFCETVTIASERAPDDEELRQLRQLSKDRIESLRESIREMGDPVPADTTTKPSAPADSGKRST